MRLQGKVVSVVVASAGLVAGVIGCESDYKKAGGDPAVAQARLADREAAARATIDKFIARAPSIRRFLDTSAGFAVFPEIAKGGAGIGGAHGDGVVFQNGQAVGYTTLSQGTIGFQLGGQVYSEIIFFQTPQKLDEFKRGNMELSAQVSGVAADEGKARNADFTDGVAVFTLPIKGLMGEAAAGGQKFSYLDKANAIPAGPAAPIRDAGSVPPPPPPTSPSPAPR
jgi:lipid-binding SYLF domain-containing protein